MAGFRMFCFFKRLYFRSPVYIKVNVVLRYYRLGPDFIYVKKVNDTVSRISLLNNYFELVLIYFYLFVYLGFRCK